MPELEANDWREAVKVLKDELNRQARDLRALREYVTVLELILVRDRVFDRAELDQFFEGFAKASDETGDLDAADRWRKLKGRARSSAEVLSFPSKLPPSS